jgi:hypothetical protein
MKRGSNLKELLLTLMWGFVLVPPGSAGVPSDYWIIGLLTFAILILMFIEREFGWSETIAAALVSFSLCVPAGKPAAILACPWLLVRSWHALLAFRQASNLCLTCCRIFPAIGAAWLVAHRANWTPWNFDSLIVLLTAAHFHHAGFTLPLMAGLNAKTKPNWLTKSSCIAILVGVPMVALGITCTHFGVLRFVEPVGVTALVLGALGVAVSQIQRGLERENSALTRSGFVISGASLLAAMLLALGFGLRYVFPNLALTMPQMWMIHGTLNAFGFGLCGILAWRGASR